MEKCKAVFYARVSTVSTEQETSIESQIQLCREFLEKNPKFELAAPIDSYVEKESGKSDLRKRYEAMMKQIASSNGEIQYLIVKDLYRLSRSAEVSSGIKRFCKTYDVKLVLLANKGNEIYDPSEEQNRLLYGVQALLAEEYVYNQSKLARVSHAQKMAARRLNRNNQVFGYRWDYDLNDMVVNEAEIEIVKRVFEAYVFENKGVGAILQMLSEEYGKTVSRNTVKNWLTDTSYVGRFVMNKSTTVLGVGADSKSRRYRNNPSEYVIVDRPDLKTIDERLFNMAQEIRKRKTINVNKDKNGVRQERFKGTSLFASKIYCGCCENTYYIKHADRTCQFAIYKCSDSLKRIKVNCENEYSRIYEDDVKDLIRLVINAYIQKNKSLNPVIIKLLKKHLSENGNAKEIAKLRKDIQQMNKMIDRFRIAYINEENELLRSDLHEQYLKSMEKAQELNKSLEEKLNHSNSDVIKTVSDRIKAIEQVLSDMDEVLELNRDIIDGFIDRICIRTDGDIDVILNSYGSFFRSSVPESLDTKRDDLRMNLFTMDYTFKPKDRIIRKASGYMTKNEMTVKVNVSIII